MAPVLDRHPAGSGTSTSASTRDNLRLFEHPKEKLSHYSDRTVDIEYKFGFQGNPWGELEGVANRTDFDLSTHSKHSGIDLSFYDQATDTRYVPYVIEPAAGLTRSFMAFLVDAYTEDEAPNAKGGVDKRTVLRLDPRLAPVKAAVLPLSRHADLSPKARDLAAELRKPWNVEFDDAGAIGRRYRRQDEIGTPFCVTVDFDTLEDHAVTIRERDAMAQERVAHRRGVRLPRGAPQGLLALPASPIAASVRVCGDGERRRAQADDLRRRLTAAVRAPSSSAAPTMKLGRSGLSDTMVGTGFNRSTERRAFQRRLSASAPDRYASRSLERRLRTGTGKAESRTARPPLGRAGCRAAARVGSTAGTHLPGCVFAIWDVIYGVDAGR